jgi:predicted TIM-barrel fold metal-dependent hydrolase
MSSDRGGFALRDRQKPASSDELARLWKPYVETCIEEFGTTRCMFESNFPMDKQWVPYNSLWNAFKKLTSSFSASEKRDLFFQTAIDFYSLKLPGNRGAERQPPRP